MRKLEIAKSISAKSGIPVIDILIVVDTLFKEINEAMLSNENVYFSNFGNFGIKNKPLKRGGLLSKRHGKAKNYWMKRVREDEFMPVFTPCQATKRAVSAKFDKKN